MGTGTDSPSALLKNFTALSREEGRRGDGQGEDASDNMKSYGLEFDASYFRANREISISSEVKHFLRQPPNRRTPEQIQTPEVSNGSKRLMGDVYVLFERFHRTILYIQTVKVTPKRTIIRQGHFAENFYFILSGQALVTIHKPGDVTPKTAGMMRRGTSFGELALLHHSQRTATVTSHDTVQLLSVGREDFFDIFMAGHGSESMPDHIKFISQLDFMKDWPLERLLERPDQCLLHFFKRNMVILKASEVSEWFYVVKSGTCQVLKQLKGVTGRLGQMASSRHATHDTEGKLRSGASFQDKDKIIVTCSFDLHGLYIRMGTERLQPCPEEEHEGADNSDPGDRAVHRRNRRHGDQRMGKGNPHPGQSFSKLSIGPPHFRSMRHLDSESKENRKYRGQGSFSYHRRQKRKQQQHHEKQQSQQQQHQQQESPPVFVQIELLKPRDVFGLDMVNFNSVDFQRSPVSLKGTYRLQPCPEEEQDGADNSDPGDRAVHRRNRRHGDQRMGKGNPHPGQSFSKLSIGPPHFRSMRHLDSESKENRKYRGHSSFSYHRRQKREQQQQHEKQQSQQQQHQQQESPPVFVQIELLKPRDVFGLDMVNFNSVDFQRSPVSLVSLGAECIMLSKAFFLKHANERVKRRFSELVQPYPDERSLQASLQNKADWELYKNSLLAAITGPKPTGLRGAPLASRH
ncbi:hypothetical protein EGW08_019472 [Elysia chlorotica]|uniref:Cyclic nucleotide-binding domain-containing protein n=1 Tax=Elysia chlorotica TaxID=188477 RepID=A0A433SU62_ELYCH|nr:hypothetical protein EGW08_019472 [Elysia chlorotica]